MGISLDTLKKVLPLILNRSLNVPLLVVTFNKIFLYKNNFLRPKVLLLAKNLRTS